MRFWRINVAEIFSRDIEREVDAVLGKCAMGYVDEILMFLKDQKERIEELELVAKLLKQGNLKDNPEKCGMFTKRNRDLEEVVDEEGIEAQQGNADAIKRFQIPRNKKDIQRFH
eukprot:GHVN01074468.1.p1 GENE.GHVN01074468.1~~GHVN01074468.1.p1  ORF type:complete len:114 (+),score=13.79 GHVN01074468.1:120-461(+)